MFFTATKFFKFKMVKDTVQSLKAENDKLKEKVEEVYVEIKKVQENLKDNRAGGHVASACDPDALKSLDFLSEESDVLKKFRDRALDQISTLEKAVKELSTKVSKVSIAIDQVQEYSCSSISNLLASSSWNHVKIPSRLRSFAQTFSMQLEYMSNRTIST